MKKLYAVVVEGSTGERSNIAFLKESHGKDYYEYSVASDGEDRVAVFEDYQVALQCFHTFVEHGYARYLLIRADNLVTEVQTPYTVKAQLDSGLDVDFL